MELSYSIVIIGTKWLIWIDGRTKKLTFKNHIWNINSSCKYIILLFIKVKYSLKYHSYTLEYPTVVFI